MFKIAEIQKSWAKPVSYLQLLYVSRSRVQPGAEADAIHSICTTARRRNAELDLTGCLAFGSGVFIQVLEGKAAAVEEVLARIVSDPRHEDIRILMKREIGTRSFPRWRMAGISPQDMNMISQDPQTLPAVVLLSQLMLIAERSMAPNPLHPGGAAAR